MDISKISVFNQKLNKYFRSKKNIQFLPDFTKDEEFICCYFMDKINDIIILCALRYYSFIYFDFNLIQ